MITYYVMYWNDNEDCPIAVFEVKANTQEEAEQIAYNNGGKDYEDEWPLLTEVDLSDSRIKRYKSQPWKIYYKEVK